MKLLMLFSDSGDLLIYFSMFVIGFLICVFITRWVFGIDDIIKSLRKQNEYSIIQIQLLKKMLRHHGVSKGEIEQILDEVKQKKGK